ncbi:Putative regulatory protein, FmdB [Limnobacter sp. MED105]|jgi:putative FmdB family regulatory protein|nr:Putative regulatory protein, FmdB [Limnobacter sp. MED105]
MGSFSFVFAGVAEMPIYAYRCEACGFEKDVLQKLSDAPLTQCPSCGQPSFAKQVTAAGFQLKGSGWYVTDFRGGSSASSAAGSTAGPTAAPTAASSEAPSASSSSATAPSTDAS